MGVHGATDQILRSDEIEHVQGSVVVDPYSEVIP